MGAGKKQKMIWLILLLAFVLRIINLNQSLWLDEGTQATLSSESLQLILYERGVDFHPPLSYFLLHFWMMLGTSEVWLRLLSVIFGVATILIVYLLVKKIFNQQVALISALFLALAPYHIYYSQEIRMYSEATFFATVSIYFLIKLLDEKNWRFKLGYILSTTFLIYTFYLGFFLIIAQAVYVFFQKRNKLVNFLSLVGITGVLWIPWVPQFLIQLKSGLASEEYLPGWSGILSLPTLKAVPVTFIKFSLGRVSIENQVLYLSVALVIITIFGYLLLYGAKSLKNNQKIIFYWLIIPLVLAIIVSWKIPLNQPFRLLFILPAFYILLAVGDNSLKKYRKLALGTILLVSILGIYLYNFNHKFWREDWREAVAYTNNNCQQNCQVIFVWSEPFAPFQWYRGNNGIGLIKKFPANQFEINENMVKLSNKEKLLVFDYLQDLTDPGRLTYKWLTGHGFKEIEIHDFNGVGFIRTYVKS